MPEEFDDILSDPNNGAYIKKEKRKGPPLSYVAEKIRNSIEASYSIHARALAMPENTPERQSIYSNAYDSFRNGIVAYLALHNYLVLADDPKVYDQLLKSSMEELKAWLDHVQKEGSLT